MNHNVSSQMSSTDTACRDLCTSCAQTCLHTLFRHCLPAGGEHADAQHVRLMMDCAEICQTAAHFMDRGSPFHFQVCAACAEICRACAESCRNLDGMHDCVVACERCETACNDMARDAA